MQGVNVGYYLLFLGRSIVQTVPSCASLVWGMGHY